MKTLLCLITAAALCSAPLLQAKPASPQKPAKEHTTEKPKEHTNPSTSNQLTSAEQTELNAALAKAAKDPSVIKAKESLEKLQKATPQDTKAIAQANKQVEQATRTAAIKADSKVSPLFNKQDAAKKTGK